ncbi:unnamed protein product [Caenorhabditis angaria]|uniref:RING-CH-type domain-containing protein n=1 Tax=Caenorhabditis angaria TaxID=860376 RepID=A0A9P1IAY6_9PELO|nr:unnamed protein product [Caenorhabditis angaria]
MGLVLSVLSVVNEESERICKFCYGEEGEEKTWLHPCRCIGTLHWVHYTCFDLWMNRASAQQQLQCQTCRYVYRKSWVLKSLKDWKLPQLDLNTWQWLEILLDVYSTYKFVRGFIWTVEGRRSVFTQMVHFFFWRTFIMSDRRIAWYLALGRKCLTAAFQIDVQPYDERRLEESEDSSFSSESEEENDEIVAAFAHLAVVENREHIMNELAH